VLPADALAGETLYLYVGESGQAAELVNCNGVTDQCINLAAGGAASMATTTQVPDSFVSAGCGGNAEDLDALVIAGSGSGANGDLSKAPAAGGAGGIAVGGSGVQNVIGAGLPGLADPTSYGGQAPLYGSNPYNGSQTVSGGVSVLEPFNVNDQALTNSYFGGGPTAPGGAGGGDKEAYQFAKTWFSNTSFLTLPAANNQGCSGGQTQAGGSGGGGHAGGGGVSIIDHSANGTEAWQILYGAGGGGSSWVAGAGEGVTLPASLSAWQTLSDESPG